METKEAKISDVSKNYEQLESKSLDQQLQIQNLTSLVNRLSNTEKDLSSKLASNKSRLVSQENSIRKSGEENYALKTEIKNLQTDLINMVSVEESLRAELSQT